MWRSLKRWWPTVDGRRASAGIATWTRLTSCWARHPASRRPRPCFRRPSLTGRRRTNWTSMVSSAPRRGPPCGVPWLPLPRSPGWCGLRSAIKTWDGTFAFRAIRGETHLSVHAFGAAIDLNAGTNPLGGPGDMSPDVIAVFQHFGFLWGGDFHVRKDPMHFQYATGY